MTNNTNVVLTDIEEAIQLVGQFLPTVISVAGTFYPPLKVITPFLPLLQEALNSVQIVKTATGVSTADATTAVSNHLTPGQPNSPALS